MHLSGSTGNTLQTRGMSRLICRRIVAGAVNFTFSVGRDKVRNRPLRHVSRATTLQFAVVAGEAWSKSGGERQGMNEEEFQALLAALKKFNAQHSTPEAARKALQELGVLTESGEIAEFYRRDIPAGK
jgi:hypothetical protein